MSDKLTAKQAAEILGVSASRVRQMVLDGTLKADRFGQNLAVDPESVEAAKARKTKPGPSPQGETKPVAEQGTAPKIITGDPPIEVAPLVVAPETVEPVKVKPVKVKPVIVKPAKKGKK